MLVDLVQVTASDGLRLHGALEMPNVAVTLRVPQPSGTSEAADGTAERACTIDAWLCIHGTGSNFYAASTLAGIAPKLLASGASVLRANTRGHDVVSTGPSADGRWLQGAAFERMDEAPRDLTAWIDFLVERGYRRIGLLGHSMGAIKAILTLASDDAAHVAALVAASPPRLSYSHFGESRRGDLFRETFETASEMAQGGRGDDLMLVKFPLAYYVTAANYLDRYGPEERYNVLRLLGRVKCPTLVTYGSTEMQREVAFEGMSDEVERLVPASHSLAVAVIAGADHLYTGCHDALCSTIAKWLARMPSGEDV